MGGWVKEWRVAAERTVVSGYLQRALDVATLRAAWAAVLDVPVVRVAVGDAATDDAAVALEVTAEPGEYQTRFVAFVAPGLDPSALIAALARWLDVSVLYDDGASTDPTRWVRVDPDGARDEVFEDTSSEGLRLDPERGARRLDADDGLELRESGRGMAGRIRVEVYARRYVGWSRLRRAVAAALELLEREVDEGGAAQLTVRAFRGDVRQRIVLDVVRAPSWQEPEVFVRALAARLGQALWVPQPGGRWTVFEPSGELTSRPARFPLAEAASDPYPGDGPEAWLEHAGFHHLDEIGNGWPASLFHADSEGGPVLVTFGWKPALTAESFARALAYGSPRALPLVALRLLGDAHALLVEELPSGVAMASGGPWTEADVRRVGAALVEELAVLHASGATVGMLWPELVFAAGSGGEARLTGFSPRHHRFLTSLEPVCVGVVRPLSTSSLAPELLLDKPETSATDVFALGVLLFRLAAGAMPFEGEGRAGLLGVLKNQRSASRVSDPLGALLDRMLRIEARERPALDEVREALRSELPDASTG